MANGKTPGDAPDPRVELGRRLRAEREAVKVSQRKLAKLLGLDQEAICRIEAGTQRLPAHLVPEWARLLGVRVERLYGEIPATAALKAS